MAPIICHLLELGVIEAAAYHQNTCFDAAVSFAQAEGHILAPETSHAVRAAMDAALECKKTGESKVILFNASGHGHFDMSSFQKYFEHDLEDYEYPEEELQKALATLPNIE